MRFVPLAVVGATALLLPACGGNSSGVASRTAVRFPSQTFTFVTSTGLNVPAGGTLPSVPCAMLLDCESGLFDSPNTFVNLMATLKCVQDGPSTSPTCVAQFPETLSSMVTLAGQSGVSGGESLCDITITSLSYTVSNDTMGVDLLGFTLYLAPSGVTDPNDPQAIAFGTLPTLPSGTAPQGEVQLLSNSVETIEMFTRNTSLPFELLAAATVNVPGGSLVGHLTVTVSGTLSAYAVASCGG